MGIFVPRQRVCSTAGRRDLQSLWLGGHRRNMRVPLSGATVAAVPIRGGWASPTSPGTCERLCRFGAYNVSYSAAGKTQAMRHEWR